MVLISASMSGVAVNRVATRPSTFILFVSKSTTTACCKNEGSVAANIYANYKPMLINARWVHLHRRLYCSRASYLRRRFGESRVDQ
jgi:hypothetical protein